MKAARAVAVADPALTTPMTATAAMIAAVATIAVAAATATATVTATMTNGTDVAAAPAWVDTTNLADAFGPTEGTAVL